MDIVQQALVQAFHQDAKSKDAKEAMKGFVHSQSVASKLAHTFVDSELMQTAITQFKRKRMEDAVTDTVDKRYVTIFAENMRIDDKTTAYPAGNRAC